MEDGLIVLIPYALALGGVCAFVVFAQAVIEIDRWREWHHVYVGIALVTVGVVLMFAAPTVWLFAVGLALALLGNWVAWDDALAHYAQSTDADYLLRAAHFAPGTMGGLDAPYSWWHRFAARQRVI